MLKYSKDCKKAVRTAKKSPQFWLIGKKELLFSKFSALETRAQIR
jgi:hypothetical protein